MLRRLYRRYNRRYFGGRLPGGMRLVAFGGRQLPREALGYYVGGPGVVKYRRRDRTVKRVRGPVIMVRIADGQGCPMHGHQVAMTLLHEMNHVDVGSAAHGRRFQRGMRRLARAGAFAGLW